MNPIPNITLEQWQTLVAIVEQGGYSQAAACLHKSQSAVTYAVQKIEELLGVKIFTLQGRKAMLTPAGQMLYRRARSLLDEAFGLEKTARTLSAGWEPEIRIAVEILFPNALLLQALSRFGNESRHTRIEVYESVLSGTSEALLERKVDIAISPVIPPGFMGDRLFALKMIAVAHPDHPLHHMDQELTYRDLRDHRHLLVRDSGMRRGQWVFSVEVDQRWTFSHTATSIKAACAGHGFAWFPETHMSDELRSGLLKPLPLREGRERNVELYLILADPNGAGPGARRLVELLREEAAAFSV